MIYKKIRPSTPLAQFLVARLAELGLNLMTLSAASGVSHSVISKLVNGRVKSATNKTLAKLAPALGVSSEYLWNVNAGESMSSEEHTKRVLAFCSIIQKVTGRPILDFLLDIIIEISEGRR